MRASMKATFTVMGDPTGKGRPRFRKAGERMIAYTDKKTADYEDRVRSEYRKKYRGMKFADDAMLDMRIIAYYAIPKSAAKGVKNAMEAKYLRPTKTPDADNLLKAVADSLNKIAYRDDAQIVDCQVRKYYSYQPRIEVTILAAKN